MSKKTTEENKDEKIINDSLSAATLICGLDQACLYLKNNKTKNYVAKYFWQQETLFDGAYLQKIITPNKLFWCMSKAKSDNEIFVSKLGDLNEIAPADMEILEDSKVGAFAMLPVFCDDSLEAIFALYKYGKIKDWKEGEKAFLRMVASVFSLQITKNQAVSKYLNLKNAKEEKSQISQNMTKTFENFQTVVIVTDKESIIEYVNPMFTKVTGYEFSEVIGKKPSILKSGKMQDEIYKNLWKTITSGDNWRGEIINRRKNGDLFWQDSRISPIFDSNKKITHYIAINDDISEVKKLREHLEKEVNNKSEFIAFMSHEIRTPLNGIYGLATELLETKIDDTQKDSINTIISSCGSLEKILSDVLDLSKIESKQMKLDNVVFDLKMLIDGVIKLMIPHADKKKIGLAYNIEDSVGRFFVGDPLRLRQVIVNIINNAMKFTEKGGITVSVSCCEGDKNSQSKDYLFQVKDTGIGMTEQEGARIFKAFTQADISIASKYGGTGLGLAISHNLISLMGGAIGFETKPEKGSIFWFKIPLAESFKKPEKFEQDTFYEMPEPSIKPLNILLAEDSPINIKVAISLLGKRGHNITVVHNGEDAVEAVCSADFDMVLMDIHMPIMDGFEATKKIRKLEGKKAKIPIIALTGEVFLGENEKYFASGMDWCIGKPIYLPELLNILAKFAPKEKVENQNNDLNDKHLKNQKPQKDVKNGQFLDVAVIEMLISEIDNKNLLSLFKDFFVYAKEQVEGIKKAFDLKDYENVKIYSHSFKSTSSSVGFANLSSVNAKIELECRKQTYKDLKSLCIELDESYQKSLTEFIKFYPQLLQEE